MYWVVALFNEETEQKVMDIWQELCDQSISYYVNKVKDGKPHLTLASYEQLDKETFMTELEAYCEGKEEVALTFNTVGSFLNYDTVFLSPVITTDLLKLHGAYHQAFAHYKEASNELYEPEQWIPHCTLANQPVTGNLSDVFGYCQKHVEPISGTIDRIAIIEKVGEENGKLVAPVIYTKRLSKSGVTNG